MIENKFHNKVLHQTTKGLGIIPINSTLSDVGAQQWSILKEDVSLPVAVLRESRITHNLQWMQNFIQTYGVHLAPHGKTTMCPDLFHRQLEHGAWGITLATAPQVNAAFQNGIRRIILANQLIGKANMRLISNLKAADPDFQFYCLVDSASNIDALGQHFADAGQILHVLIEYGVEGGRTGIRNEAQERIVLNAIQRWPHSIRLTGIEVYEGVLQEETGIRGFLQHVVERTRYLSNQGFFGDETVILTGAGSAWYDVVADEFSGIDIGQPLTVILRPGCYLTHDVGVYSHAEKRIGVNNAVARKMGKSLLPALMVWAYVQSIPESGRAIVTLGKRDAAFDAGLPIPSLYLRPSTMTSPIPASSDWKMTAMNDQHGFMDIANDDLEVGDMIGFDISHPCLTFDKWRHLLIVDDDFTVTDIVQTYF